MKPFPLILAFILASCAAAKPDHAEQATLTCYIKEAKNRAVCKLLTTTGKTVIYYDRVRGMGEKFWKEGDRYTVHFKSNTIIKITRNQ